MTAPRKREGMVAKTPAQRQADRRARGARAVMLSGDVLAQLDEITTYLGGGTRSAGIEVLIFYARQALTSAPWHE